METAEAVNSSPFKSTKAKRALIKTKSAKKKEPEVPEVYTTQVPSDQLVTVNLKRVTDMEFRMRLPTGVRDGMILCRPGRFVEQF